MLLKFVKLLNHTNHVCSYTSNVATTDSNATKTTDFIVPTSHAHSAKPPSSHRAFLHLEKLVSVAHCTRQTTKDFCLGHAHKIQYQIEKESDA